MRTKIDGKDLRGMSIDEIGAVLQAIASELNARGNDAETNPSTSRRLLWAVDEIEEAARWLF